MKIERLLLVLGGLAAVSAIALVAVGTLTAEGLTTVLSEPVVSAVQVALTLLGTIVLFVAAKSSHEWVSLLAATGLLAMGFLLGSRQETVISTARSISFVAWVAITIVIAVVIFLAKTPKSKPSAG